MRLINVHTQEFETFLDERQLPPYAILSHTWDGKEVQYHHFLDQERCRKDDKLDFTKIDFTCAQAKRDSLEYAWIDTCCIDKTSSAELSEAINSMFRWYQKSTRCYVFLSDVELPSAQVHEPDCTPGDTHIPWVVNKKSDEQQTENSKRDPSTHPLGAVTIKRYAQDLRLQNNPLITRSGFSRGSGISRENRLRPSIGVGLVVLSACGSALVPAVCDRYRTPSTPATLTARPKVGQDGPLSGTTAATSIVGKSKMPSRAFCESRWLTRGWTLQELLAPSCISFYDCAGLHLGTRHDFLQAIKSVTGIPEKVLTHELLPIDCSIAMRMSWASKRSTTRLEDEAYCLLGLFDVNMPLLYGEGSRAFLRLQEEIVKQSTDQSILVYEGDRTAIFAPAPWCFERSASVTPVKGSAGVQNYEMTNSGLRISLRLYTSAGHDSSYRHRFALLDCIDSDRPECFIGIPLEYDASTTYSDNNATTTTIVPASSPVRVPAFIHISPNESPGFYNETMPAFAPRYDVLIPRARPGKSLIEEARFIQLSLHPSASELSCRVRYIYDEVRVILSDPFGRTYVVLAGDLSFGGFLMVRSPRKTSTDDFTGIKFLREQIIHGPSSLVSYKSYSSAKRLKVTLHMQPASLPNAGLGKLLTVELVPVWLRYIHGKPRLYTKLIMALPCVLLLLPLETAEDAFSDHHRISKLSNRIFDWTES